MNTTKILPESQVVSAYLSGKTLKELQNIYALKSYGPIVRVLKSNKVIMRNKGDLRPSGSHDVDISFFECIDSPIKAYWLGFIVADGHIQKDGRKTSLISKDKEVLEKFKVAIKSNHPIGTNTYYDARTSKYYTSHSLQIGSKHFTHHLINQGVTNAKSSQCVFPEIPETLYPHFVRGLFDGDGCICFLKSGKRRMSLIATDAILNFLKDYFKKNFGFTPTVFSRISTNGKAKNSKLHIHNKKNQDAFLKFIYQDSTAETRLTRKYLLSLREYVLQKSGPKSRF
jgi:hypothetical protein